MKLVRFFILLNKENCHIHKISIEHSKFLNYFIWIFGNLFPKLPYMVINIFLTIIEYYSHYTWIVLLKLKTEVKLHIQNFISLIENQFQAKEKIIRHANGPEFLLKDFFASKWILHQTSCVYTPQQNGSWEETSTYFKCGKSPYASISYPKQFLVICN